jgi:CBS domain-containing protein
LHEIAEPPLFTLEASMDLDEAFRALEEQDFERVPVVEDGRLVGILSRTVLQRRLAEDEPPPPLEP